MHSSLNLFFCSTVHFFVHALWIQYLAVRSPRQLCLNHHDNNAKHPADQRVVTQLFALPKESFSLTQPVADILSLLLWFPSGQVFAVGLTGIFSDDFGECIFQDGAVKKLKRLLA